MAKENVEIVFSANTEQARALFSEMRKGLDGVSQTAMKSSQSVDGLEGSLGRLVSRYSLLAGGITLATQAIARHNEELRKSADSSRHLEEIVNRIANQAGLPRGTELGVKKRVFEMARATGTSNQQAGAAIEQLVSSGFDFRETSAAGGSGEVFLQMIGALNQSGRGQDPRMLAESVSKFFQGTGQAKNAESMKRFAPQLFNLFMGTNIQAQHMGDLGPVAASLTARGISPTDQLATMSMLADIMPASVGATGFSSIAGRVGSAGSQPEVQRGLKMMGLQAGDVDMVGESFLDVIGRIRGGVAGMPAEQRASAMRLVAGQEQLKVLESLTANLDEVQRRRGMMGGTQAYETAVRRNLGSIGAMESATTAMEEYYGSETYGRDARLNEVLKRRAYLRARVQGYKTGTPILTEGAGYVGEAIEKVAPGQFLREFESQGGTAKDITGEIKVILPNKTRVPGVIKATENLEGMLKSAAGAGGGLN